VAEGDGEPVKVYAIIQRNGEIKRSKRSAHLMIYTTREMARRCASCDGDSVVEVDIDLNKEPLFIRSKRLGS